MNRLPPHHVPRPRLTGRSAGYRVIVVEAAAGYGKSVLSAELVDHWRSVGIDVQLEHAGVSLSATGRSLLPGRPPVGVHGRGGAAEGKQDPVEVVDTLVDSLAAEHCTFVVDDAHHAEPDAGELIDHLARSLEGEQRLVVLARRLPPGTGRLRRAEYLQLSAADLALDPNETLLLCRDGFGLDVGRRPRWRSTKRRGAGRPPPSWPRPGRPGPARRWPPWLRRPRGRATQPAPWPPSSKTPSDTLGPGCAPIWVKSAVCRCSMPRWWTP